MTNGAVESRWGAHAVDARGANLPALKVSFLLENVPTTGVVVEIGSGEGKLLRTLASLRPKLTLHGCDVRPPLSAADAYEFRRIDAERLPYDDATFDAVLIFDVLEHVPDPARTIEEAARVLKPGGAMVAFVPVEGEPQSFYEIYRRLLGRDLYARTKEHIQAFTHEGLRAIVDPRFDITMLRYAYHPIGQFLDASFFAAARLDFVREFWWKENVYYAGPNDPPPGLVTRGINALLQMGNAAAYAESKLLARSNVGAAGVLFAARVRG